MKLIKIEEGCPLPSKIDGWQHTKQVLVFYPAIPNGKVETWGVAYYNYNPPFDLPGFVDFKNYGRKPTHWAEIPFDYPQHTQR